jgi:hypothetical protein
MEDEAYSGTAGDVTMAQLVPRTTGGRRRKSGGMAGWISAEGPDALGGVSGGLSIRVRHGDTQLEASRAP